VDPSQAQSDKSNDVDSLEKSEGNEAAKGQLPGAGAPKEGEAAKTDGAKTETPAASTSSETTPAKAETKTETKAASKSAAD